MTPSTDPLDPSAAEALARTLVRTLVRNLGFTLLACVLVLAQTLLALHELEHLGQVEQERCETCTAGASLGAGQVAGALLLVPAARSPVSQPIAIAYPRLGATFNAHPARAPPMDVRYSPRSASASVQMFRDSLRSLSLSLS
jgi:hypothetical protein